MRHLLFAPAGPGHAQVPVTAWLLNLALAGGLLACAFTFAFLQLQYHWNWPAAWRYRALFWQGWVTTVVLALGSLLLSTVFGLTAAFLGRSRLLLARAGARLYVELIRGTPLLVQILVLFYIVAPAFQVENRYLVGMFALSLFAGAYLSEILRAGIESVGRTQWETARAIGLTRAQTYRFVVFPQAVRQVLPPVAGQFVSLIKDSSLLSVIGIGELTLQAQQANALTYSTLESYLPLALGYLILTLPLSLWTRQLERRAHFET